MAVLARPALGQAAPPAIAGIAGKSALTDSDRANIETYARYWTDALTGTDDPSRVAAAKHQLLAPLAGRPSIEFRNEYGKGILAPLDSNLADVMPYAASSALIVIARLGTQQALSALIAQLEPRSPLHVRITASRGVKEILQSGSVSDVNPNVVSGLARRLRDAAARESHWVVLAHLIQGILAADRFNLTPPIRQQVEDALVSTISDIATRAADSDDVEQAVAYSNALHLALSDVRNHMLSGADAQKITLAQMIGPALVTVLTIPSEHWEAGHANETLAREFERTIRFTEITLGLSHPLAAAGEKAPPPTLQQAWRSRNANEFASGLSSWQQLVSKPPYR